MDKAVDLSESWRFTSEWSRTRIVFGIGALAS